jgi:hypothetical protein
MANTQPQNLREQMPRTAKRVDIQRRRYGTDKVNARIKQGMAGQAGCFYALENGFEVGTPSAGFKAFMALFDGLGKSFKFECADDIALRRRPARGVISMGSDGVDILKLTERLL